MNLLFVDTETTDLGESGRLIQIAYKTADVHDRPTSNPEIVSAYFKPTSTISFEAMSVNHITNEMLMDKIYFSESEEKKDLETLQNNHVLIAHNAPFDKRILEHEGLKFPLWIDTKRVAMHLFESPKYKLQYLRYSLNLNVQGMAHDAVGDVAVLEKLFYYLYDLVSKRVVYNIRENVISHMMVLSVPPVLIKKFDFGKYKGSTLDEVFEFDRRYFSWLYNNQMAKMPSDRDENLIFTLQSYLNNGPKN